MNTQTVTLDIISRDPESSEFFWDCRRAAMRHRALNKIDPTTVSNENFVVNPTNLPNVYSVDYTFDA